MYILSDQSRCQRIIGESMGCSEDRQKIYFGEEEQKKKFLKVQNKIDKKDFAIIEV